MKTTLIGIAFIVLAALASAGGTYYANQHPAPVAPKAGAVSGPIDQSNYHCYAGVCDYYGSGGLKAATTTPCAIQAPAATSTVSASIRLDTGSTTATTWTVAVSSNPYSTTTPLGTNYLLAANAQGFDFASSTAGQNIVPPNNWIVFSETGGITAGDAGTGFVPAGQCRATFVTTLL